MCVLHRVLQQTGSDQAGRVSHIHHEDGAHLVSDGAHALPIPFAGVGRCTADDQLGFVFQRLALHIVVVDQTRFRIQLISDCMIEDTGDVDRGAVGEVTAVCEVEAHESVARFEACLENGHVGLCAGVRLYVGELCVKDLFDAVDSQLFDLVYHLAAAVVACAGITFRIFVGTDAAEGFEHLLTDKVLRCNEFEATFLAFFFFLNEIQNLDILFHTM